MGVNNNRIARGGGSCHKEIFTSRKFVPLEDVSIIYIAIIYV